MITCLRLHVFAATRNRRTLGDRPSARTRNDIVENHNHPAVMEPSRHLVLRDLRVLVVVVVSVYPSPPSNLQNAQGERHHQMWLSAEDARRPRTPLTAGNRCAIDGVVVVCDQGLFNRREVG